MDLNQTMEEIDGYFAAGDVAGAQATMEKALAEALAARQEEAILPLLNELMGCYRETSQVEASYRMAEQAVKMIKTMGLSGTLVEATTYLNAANVYRAGGRWMDSLDCYERAEQIYADQLDPRDMLVASYHNNISLLYQEMGDFAKAKEALLCALAIVRTHPEAVMEEAVTCANLSATCVELGQEDEGEEWADLAIEMFEKNGIRDAHYMAALSAKGSGLFRKGRLEDAAVCFKKAMEGMESLFGKNEFYARLEENYRACRPQSSKLKGLELCRAYYHEVVAPMLCDKFSKWQTRIAVGLAGEGSDCFGWDDEYSRDHDWGPDVCLWVSRATYEEIGKDLEEAYANLPEHFHGETRRTSARGDGRRGVQVIEKFFGRLTGADTYEGIDWNQVTDAGLAAGVNGEIFRDDEGMVSAWRHKLGKGYPEKIRLIRMAEAAALFSQNLQYNLPRLRKRQDPVSEAMVLGQGIENALKLSLYIEGMYPAHPKGMLHQLKGRLLGATGAEWKKLISLLERLTESAYGLSDQVDYSRDMATGEAAQTETELIEEIAAILWNALVEEGLIMGGELYLDAYVPQLVWRAAHADKSREELAEEIAEAEFRAFQNVKNMGGRADCQDDWKTFSIMRRSQYLTWTVNMLLQYLFEFETEYARGRNLIEEKYARMMESTAPAEYAGFKDLLPALSERTRQIIDVIAGIQVGWMEEFAGAYPRLAGNARSIRTGTDTMFNTSYETYLRGELGTYSPFMLKLYGNFIADCGRTDRNLARETFANSARLYGYDSLEAAEQA